MDEMSVRLDDGTNFGEAFFLLVTVRLRGWMKPSLKKLGDFTVAEGHGHPLVRIKADQ
jgi:hypothetical protein